MKSKKIFVSLIILFSLSVAYNSFGETIDAANLHTTTTKNGDRDYYEGKLLDGDYDIFLKDSSSYTFNNYVCDNPMSAVKNIHVKYNNGVMDYKTIKCYSYNDSLLFESVKNTDSTFTAKSYDTNSNLRRIFNYNSSFLIIDISTFYNTGELFELTAYDSKKKSIVTTEYNKDKSIKKIKTFKNGKLKSVEIK